jgi:hypothetical protein
LTSDQQALLLSQLAALNIGQVREFMNRHGVAGKEGKKAEVLARSEAALRRRGKPTWDELMLYLDEVEPYGRQHAYLYKPKPDFKKWSSGGYVENELAKHKLGTFLGRHTALAAPANVTLASISLDEENGIFSVHAITKRTHLRRREDLDSQVSASALPDPNTVAQVYEEVSVRSWVRLRCDANTGACSVHVAQLERKGDYEAVVQEFLNLISTWFPVGQLEPINLAKAIASLHEDYEANSNTSEVRVQGAQFDTVRGRHAAISSARARQGVLGESPQLDGAITAMRKSGPAAAGNFYFRETGSANSANPIDKDLHVTCVVKDSRINFRRPTEPDEFNWVLERIRYHAR